jgi:hypothetical protein
MYITFTRLDGTRYGMHLRKISPFRDEYAYISLNETASLF